MKINIIKPHLYYTKGIHNVDKERGRYLLMIKVAEKIENKIVYNDDKPIIK